MAKKGLFESITQSMGSVLAGTSPQWSAPQTRGNTQRQTTVKKRPAGTGSQTTGIGRTIQQKKPERQSDGLEVLRQAQAAMNGEVQPLSLDTASIDEQRKQAQQAAKLNGTDTRRANVTGETNYRNETQRERTTHKTVDTSKDAKKGWTLGEVLTDPVGAASVFVEGGVNAFDDALDSVLHPKKARRENEQRLAQNQRAKEINGGKGVSLGDMAEYGADQFLSSLTGVGDMTLGNAARAMGFDDNIFSQWNANAKKALEADAAYFDKSLSNSGKVKKFLEGEAVPGLVAMLPDVMLAMATGGESAVLEGAQRAGIPALRKQLLDMAKSPGFWSAFTREAGSGYNEQIDKGRSEDEAARYAILNGLGSAIIEMSGGIQKLPGEMQTAENALLSLLKSGGSEALEETTQGALAQANENLLVGADNPLFSTTDQNAIINPARMGHEALLAGTIGLMAGAPSAATRGAQNIAARQNERANAQQESAEPVQGVEALQNASMAINAQNATESPVSNPAPQASADTEKTESAPVRSETRQSDDPWENILNMYLGDENAPAEAQENNAPTAEPSAGIEARAEFLRKSEQDVPAKEDVASGNATWHGIKLVYTPNAHYEAQNHTDTINISDKFFELDTDGQRRVLNHEVSHNISDEMLDSEGLETLNSVFLHKVSVPAESVNRARQARMFVGENEDGSFYTFEGLQGELGSNAILESTTDAIVAWFENPTWLKENHPDAYNFITEFISKKNAAQQTEPTALELKTELTEKVGRPDIPSWMQTEPQENPATQPGGDADVDAIADALNSGKKKVHGYTVFRYRDTTRDGATITVKRPDGTNIKQRIDGGRYYTNEQLNYAAAQMIAEDIGAEARTEPAQTEPVPSEPTAAELKARMEEMLGRPLTMADLDGLSNQELADRIRPAMEQDVPTRADAASVKEYAWNLFQEAQDAQERWIRGRDRNPNIKRYPAEITQIARENNITEREVLDALRDIASGNTGGGVYQSVSKMTGGVPTDANGLPEGHGPMSPAFPYREASTQTHGSDTLYNDGEREIEGLRPEDSAHKVNTDAEVDRNVQERLEFDYDGEKADLFGNKLSWDDADTAAAHKIMEAEIAQARLTGDYSEVTRLQRIWEEHGTKTGQALRERGRFAHTATDIIGEAATALEGQEDAQQTLDEIANLADEWERTRAQGNDGTESMIDLILRLNARRRTGGLFNGGQNASLTLQSTLYDVAEQEGGLDFLTNVAERQLRNLSADHARLSPLEAIKSVRYLAMLSKLNTTMRNLLGNTVFDITETVSNNIATPLDMLLSLRTGRRTTAHDASWFSESKRQGAREAAQRAYIETALDADLGDTSNRFEQRTGRTFKMDSNNPVERFLSSMEKWQRYMLTVTDEFAKGGTRAEQQRGIDNLVESGLLEDGALADWAEETARQRTFQNDGRLSGALQSLRDAGNNILSVRDSRGGSFGLGDAMLPFAQVPGNVAGQFFNYSPFGLVKGAREVFSVLRAGENATAEQQAQAVRDLGRGANGTAIVALFTAMAAKGLLKVASDDDKDKAALERDEGVSGTQLNLDAALRWLKGEDTKWRDGDDLMSIGFLEPFNGDMAMGYMLANAYKDAAADGDTTAAERMSAIVNANTEAALQAVMDLPAMSTLKNIGDAYEYSTADTTAGKVGDAVVQFLGDTAASFVPNAVAGIAQGMDEGRVRVTRTSDKRGAAAAAENAKNTLLSKIPGARGILPQALDSWGQGRQTTASPFQNWLNANLLPGAITKYDTNDVNQELFRLSETQDVNMPARNPVKEVKNGDDSKKTLTNDEQRTYQQTAGQTSFGALQQLIRSQQYAQMNDTERAAALNHLMEYGNVKGEQAVGGTKETPDWAERGGASVVQNAGFYSILEASKKQLDKDDRDKNGPQMQAILDRGLSEEDTLGVFRHILTGSSESTMEKIENAPDPLYWARNYANIQTARATLPEDDQDKNGKQMQAVLNSGVSTEDAFAQFEIIAGEGSKTVGKMRKLYDADYPLDQIVGYYIATSEKVIWDEEKGDYRARRKAEKIQWLMDTYGYTQAQANYMYKVFQNG